MAATLIPSEKLKYRKNWKESKTIIFALVALVACILHVLGIVELTISEQNEIVKLIGDIVLLIAELIGILGTIYGRIQTVHRVTPPKFLTFLQK